MRRIRLAALATSTLMGVAAAIPLGAAAGVEAAPTVAAKPSKPDTPLQNRTDNLTLPWQKKYEAIRQAGLEARLREGGTGETQQLGKNKFARVAQTGKDRIFVVLAEFDNARHPDFPDGATDAKTYQGPLHNAIPKPNRRTDNSTLWESDYNPAYFKNMYFNRMRNFYEDQSLGKYSFNGDVTEWVRVPFNEARYGRNPCGDVVCGNVLWLIRDAMAVWTKGKIDAGWSMQRIQSYLATFDIQDRYDFDGDGNFRESDGYIDHFQIVHAGGDEADGDPTYGEDAIWSHRSYANIHNEGEGPDSGALFGGVNIGEGGDTGTAGVTTLPDNPTGVWVGDYTMQPENGGLSVFAHEYGHDLGLPDLYDTSGNSGGAENSVAWWSLMSQSRGTFPADAGIGDRPMPFGAWDKYQLGWLHYGIAKPGKRSKHVLRPSQQTKGRDLTGLIVMLPDKKKTLDYGDPCGTCGSKYYFSDKGDDLDNTMTRPVTTAGAVTAKVRYDIEPGYDYAFLQASPDGTNWTSVETSVSYTGDDSAGTNPDGTGISGSSEGNWVDLTATIPTGSTQIRWRYLTDGGVAGDGFQVDNVTVGGTSVGDAETDGDWTFDGFRITDGKEVGSYLNAYFVDNRSKTRKGFDKALSHLYNFGDPDKPNEVEFFANAPGALISYWDTSELDNNVGDHPGSGLILPVDSHPQLIHSKNGTLVRPRLNSWNSAFSTIKPKAQVVHVDGKRVVLTGLKPQPLFNDRKSYWFGVDKHGGESHKGHNKPGWYSVKVPKTGTKIKILKISKKGMMKIQVN